LVLSHGGYGDHEVVSRPGHDGGEVDVHCSVVTDGLAEDNGSPDLVYLRRSRLVLDVLSDLRLWWGRGEACKVSVNLRGSGGWLRWREQLSFRPQHGR
jgi:hypothetical protein